MSFFSVGMVAIAALIAFLFGYNLGFNTGEDYAIKRFRLILRKHSRQLREFKTETYEIKPDHPSFKLLEPPTEPPHLSP